MVGSDPEGIRVPAKTQNPQNHENHHEIVVLSDIEDSWEDEEFELRIYSISIQGGKKSLLAEFPFTNPIPENQ